VFVLTLQTGFAARWCFWFSANESSIEQVCPPLVEATAILCVKKHWWQQSAFFATIAPSKAAFFKLFYSIAPFPLSTRRFRPLSLVNQRQGREFKEFHLKKVLNS